MSSSKNSIRRGNGTLQTGGSFYSAPYTSDQTWRETPISSSVISEQDLQRDCFRKLRIAGSVTGRELGFFERMYFRHTLKGVDIISIMFQIESTVPITEVAVRYAIDNLVERHPLLKMSVARDGDSYFMYEGADNKYDFSTSSRKDWTNVIKEEFDIPFSENSGLLWRIRLLNSSAKERPDSQQNLQMKGQSLSSGAASTHTMSAQCAQQLNDEESDSSFGYQATIVFIFNHAISDGGYILWLFQEFVNFLDAYNTGVDIGQIKQLPLLPPSECLTSLNGSDEMNSTEEDDDVISGSYLKLYQEQVNYDILNRYRLKFRDEIESLSARSAKNNFIFFRINEFITTMFTKACRTNGVKATTAIVTASLLALIDLLYGPKDMESEFEIPFEYMSDTRRNGHFEFEGNDQFLYPGLASISVALKARLELPQRPIPMETFWKLSKSFNKTIQSDIQTQETIHNCYKEAKMWECTPKPEGKSPFVLCFSNMGRLDGLFNEEVSKRFRLVDLLGQSSILTEAMPIFLVNTFALNGHLYGSVNFCDGFTSEKTATAYLELLQKYLTTYS